jgi:transcriptional regulator with XRE-family HTH domain
MKAMSPSPPVGMTVRTLKARMKANGVKSGYALAKLIGMSPSTTSRWLRDLVPIDVRAAALIREHLPIDPDHTPKKR